MSHAGEQEQQHLSHNEVDFCTEIVEDRCLLTAYIAPTHNHQPVDVPTEHLIKINSTM